MKFFITLLFLLFSVSAFAQEPVQPNREEFPVGAGEFISRTTEIKAYSDKCAGDMNLAFNMVTDGAVVLPNAEAQLFQAMLKSNSAATFCFKAWMEKAYLHGDIVRRGIDPSLP